MFAFRKYTWNRPCSGPDNYPGQPEEGRFPAVRNASRATISNRKYLLLSSPSTAYRYMSMVKHRRQNEEYGYIASDNGKAVGFAYGYVLNEPDGQKVYYLHAIDVMEGWQNQGYGTELVRFVHEHSKALGCRKMFLLTNKHNVSACRCYEKAGGICNAASDDIVFAFR